MIEDETLFDGEKYCEDKIKNDLTLLMNPIMILR